jgi:SpoVK/Ycf46/Vps4 family AAA+-type ATPase
MNRKVHTMPSADQLKALLKAYAQGDDEQFHSVAIQIAAGEARIGHGKLAEELRDLIDKARVRVPVGEIGRVVNSFLQMVEQDSSDSVIIAATNHSTILDRALFRRCDDIVRYMLPTEDDIKTGLRAKIAGMKATTQIQWTKLASRAKGLSYADITRAAEDALKHALIERRALTNADLSGALVERRMTLNHGTRKSQGQVTSCHAIRTFLLPRRNETVHGDKSS